MRRPALTRPGYVLPWLPDNSHMSHEPLLTLYNRHAAAAVEPPHLTNHDRTRYLAYFENEHGDQWLFVDDPASGTAVLRCGDADWTAHTIRGPQDLPRSMTDAERAWATACWQAAVFSRAHRAAVIRDAAQPAASGGPSA